jgi:hypothetical protein
MIVVLSEACKTMREKRFIAEHRGGPLSLATHRNLMGWAIACAEHALLLVQNEVLDHRLVHALHVAREWKNGNVKTGFAMKAAHGAHAAARDISDPILKSVARAIGQGVSTAHMADHAVGAALYALKAVRYAGKSVDGEKAWQDEQMKNLPPEIIDLVRETRSRKQQGFKDLREC